MELVLACCKEGSCGKTTQKISAGKNVFWQPSCTAERAVLPGPSRGTARQSKFCLLHGLQKGLRLVKRKQHLAFISR